LDRETQDYYENYFSLFQHAGWKQLIEDLEETEDSFSLINIKDDKELHFAQGQLHILNQLLNWQDSMNVAYDSNVVEESYHTTNLQ
jgi:hypothetical protein